MKPQAYVPRDLTTRSVARYWPLLHESNRQLENFRTVNSNQPALSFPDFS